MSNPSPYGSAGAPPMYSYSGASGGGSNSHRRSSYASVVSGQQSTGASQPFTQASRSGTFSHPMSAPSGSASAAQQNPTHHSRQHSRAGEPDGHTGPVAGSWSRSGNAASYGSQVGHSGNGYSGTTVDQSVTPFFVPSYLRSSRHIERLEEAHRAKVASQREMRSSHSSNAGSLSTSSSSVNLHKLVPSYRGMTHDIVERAPLYVEETVAPLPSKWNDNDKFQGLDVFGDGLDVKFAGFHKPNDEAAAVRADHPMPRQCGIYYFEVTVISKGKEGYIGIGFSGPKVPLNRLPGWEPDSWAYHGDDGLMFCCTSQGKDYGPKYSTMDTIGCGINFRTGCAFFTKNGNHLGIAFKDVKRDKLYPSVGMKKPGEHLRVNFGQTPFVYDIDAEMEREKELIRLDLLKRATSSHCPPKEETILVQKLIAQYLAHDGYVETAKAFVKEVKEEQLSLSNGSQSNVKDLWPVEDKDAVNRQRIRASILEGDIDKALKLTSAFYPAVLNKNENIYFKLKCRKFIEMIRRCTELQSAPSAKRSGTQNGQMDNYDDVFDHQMELDDQMQGHNDWERMDTEDADLHAKQGDLLNQTLKFGQELKSEFQNDPRREVKKALEDTFALIAYTDARESSLAPLLEISGRAPVAEELNSAILISLGKSSSAALERCVQQTEALVSILGEDGGPGAFVNVRKDYLR